MSSNLNARGWMNIFCLLSMPSMDFRHIHSFFVVFYVRWLVDLRLTLIFQLCSWVSFFLINSVSSGFFVSFCANLRFFSLTLSFLSIIIIPRRIFKYQSKILPLYSDYVYLSFYCKILRSLSFHTWKSLLIICLWMALVS